MDIFLSWSKTRSEAVAKALHEWVPLVLQSVRPWLSREISKGARWDDVVSRKLESCDFGIVCITPENIQSDWLLFEAGALSKKVNDARVCTYLLDLKPSDITGPLARFQHTAATKEDTQTLLDTLNAALGEQRLDGTRFRSTFEQWWPDLEARLAVAQSETMVASSDGRRTEDKIDEILLTVRALDARLQRTTASPYRRPAAAREFGFERMLAQADWDDLTPRLLAYSARRLGGANERAGDYVTRAAQAIMDGEYETNNSKSRLFPFLCGVVDDLMRRDTTRNPA